MHDMPWNHKLTVTADAEGLAGHAGGIILRAAAGNPGLTAALKEALEKEGRFPERRVLEYLPCRRGVSRYGGEGGNSGLGAPACQPSARTGALAGREAYPGMRDGGSWAMTTIRSVSPWSSSPVAVSRD